MKRERILWFDEQIRDGRLPGSSELAARFRVSLRTAQREIEFLRDRLGAPLRHGAGRKGFSYGDPGFHLPPAFFRKDETIALLFARWLLREIQAPPGTEAASAAARLDELFRETGLASLEEAVSFEAGWKSAVSDRVFFDLLRAVAQRKAVRLHPESPGKGETAVPEIEPLKLHVSAGPPRLVSRPAGRKGASISSVGRIRRVELTARQFTPPEKPVDAMELSRKGVRSGTIRNARIRFGPGKVDWAAAHEWHPNQRLQWELGGSAVLELPETRFLDVLGLLLLADGEAEVAAPAALRDAVGEEIGRLAAAYSAASAADRAVSRKRKIFSAGKAGSK